MVLLAKGSIFPVVTTVQILLRRHRPHAQIKSDGNFGPNTKGAVVGFQGQHHLSKDGVVGRDTWTRAMGVSGLQTIDVVDGTDPSLVALEAADLTAAGGAPIVVFGMSGGVDIVMQLIAARARGAGSVALLRFFGHGGRSVQDVTAGAINGSPHLAAISNDNFGQIAPSLGRIQHVFAKFASVEMHGCNVGGGPKGKSLLDKLAAVWRTPVTAGLFGQQAGGVATFRFEGPTISSFPGGGTLKSWSAGVEAASGNVTMQT